MASAPLIETTSLSISDQDELREFFATAYGGNELRISTPIANGGSFTVDRAAARNVTVSSIDSPAELEVWFAGRDEEVVFSTFTSGSAAIDHQGWNGEGSTEMGAGDVMLTIEPEVEWVHTAHPNANVAIGVSESLMREVVGADPKDTDTHWEPLSSQPIPGRAEFWRETTRFIKQTLNDPVAAEAPLVVAEAERMVASAALSVFPNKLVDRVRELDHEGGSDILRRAIAFIESNPRQDISLTEIAAAAHSGPRAVQVAFRKHMDTTPMAYLRLVRLHHVREDLLRATPADGTTVAAVCARWGFGNQGRAAELYRAQFGENPSQTLRR